MTYKMIWKISALLICFSIASCGGTRTFHEYARAGDTVAVPVGMQPNFNKNNITITITPSSGPDIVITATDPAIRAIMNLYPDPVSNMLVSRGIGEDTSAFAKTYADSLLVSSNSEKDWYQTTIFLDLPAGLPTGLTQIQVNNDQGETQGLTLEVIPGTGTANSFSSNFNGGLLLSPAILDSLARAEHTIVNIDSSSGIPHAVELTLSHDPDNTIGGTGKAFAINPLGYLKTLSWSDDGNNMKIILMQSKEGIIDHMNDYKFYIAGTATNLQMVSVKGYGINGNELAGITHTLTVNN